MPSRSHADERLVVLTTSSCQDFSCQAQYAVRATSRMLLQQLAQGCFPGQGCHARMINDFGFSLCFALAAGGSGGDAFIKACPGDSLQR